MIDLRSDTVTRPSPAMKDAMMAAPVGDDVWGDDPTVNTFQEKLAEQTGKEAALLFPSGTQSNLVALMAHCERGDEYIVGQSAHTYRYEGGGAAVLGSIQPQPIENAADGSLPLEKISAAIKADDFHFARTKLLALENTIGGKVLPAEYVLKATELARERGLATHLDGARLFNAAVATDTPLKQLCLPFDSVSLCFSKGLGAPIGSALVGSQALIDRARRWRKMVGGGMRQSGIIAAACQYALEHHIADLADDHRRAARLAEGLAKLPGVEIAAQATNMVFAHFPDEHVQPLSAWLKEHGILIELLYATRFVVHRDINDADIDKVIAVMQSYFSRL
ncbi:low-specificity L-threonine aldolase [Vreelandella venusta]|uniref:Low-specificity L-threonine aldolase n=1 Tax=Vreelandella venusta TaxID=44935 RepID=A0ABX2B5Q6_9GAMM|nr:low-specificity L-threonine aldolase [Halomonas venusta]AZM94941.1 low-specificity L-threonine aldolase [Halomonas venusta]MDW0358470.1 low-specificity L-threonine aldolase [Halomonas venusta]NPT29442.1 low-specificity L-threonine aldolase [Halomonas venusta]UQI41524.1 low-specificity L-threonine aldolase [Halomonas venusta]WAM56411.1 low-specificity L-threonine aldolase [Halomonas venusta]